MVVDLKEFKLQKAMEEKREAFINAQEEYRTALLAYASYRLMREVNKGE